MEKKKKNCSETSTHPPVIDATKHHGSIQIVNILFIGKINQHIMVTSASVGSFNFKTKDMPQFNNSAITNNY